MRILEVPKKVSETLEAGDLLEKINVYGIIILKLNPWRL